MYENDKVLALKKNNELDKSNNNSVMFWHVSILLSKHDVCVLE